MPDDEPRGVGREGRFYIYFQRIFSAMPLADMHGQECR